MIGSYRGSSGAERALRQVVEAMVMPAGVEAKLNWPVFGTSAKQGPLMAYQRRDTVYVTGQQNRLLDVDALIFDIHIWSAKREPGAFGDGRAGRRGSTRFRCGTPCR